MDDDLVRRMSEIMSFEFADVNIDRPIEPRLAAGWTDWQLGLAAGDGPIGKTDGPGRGPLSYRQALRLEALHGFWLAGYTD